MSRFASGFSVAVDRIFGHFGDDAIFTARDSAAVACSAAISHGVSQYGATVNVTAKTVVIALRKSEVCEAPRRGDVIEVVRGEYAGRTLTVDSLIGSDEFEHRVTAA